MAVEDKSDDLLAHLLDDLDIDITVGIHEDEGAEDHGGLTNAELGAIHEFGLGGQKQRSFLASYFDENADDIDADTAAAIGRVLDGADAELEAKLLGVDLEGGIKQRILARIAPPLAEATKARRGENAVPLVDSSQLLGSIKSKVTSGGS